MNNRILFFILLLSVVLRLISVNQSLWLDEGISVNVASSLSYKSIITDFSPGDFHPPLYYLVLKFFIDIFGESELTARIPSIFFGTASVLVSYFLAKKLYDARTALTSAILLATSPLLIYYSQEARMYSLATLFSLLSLFFFISILNHDKIINWLGFIICFTLALYTDYMTYFLFPAYALYLIVSRRKLTGITLKSFIPAFVLILAALAPWAGIFIKQLKIGLSLSSTSPVWFSVIGSATPKDLGLVFVKFIIGQVSMEDNLTYFLVFLPVGLYILILAAISLLRTNITRSSLWFYLLVPIISAFVFSLFIPTFSYFRLLYTLPALYIIIASAINNLHWTKPTILMLTLVLGINLIPATLYLTNTKFQREDWRSATAYIQENKSDDSIVLFESSYIISPFDYYNRGEVDAIGVLDSFNPDPDKVSASVRTATSGKSRIFLFQYLAPISDPQGLVFQSLVENGFKNTSTKDFRGVGFIYEFKK